MEIQIKALSELIIQTVIIQYDNPDLGLFISFLYIFAFFKIWICIIRNTNAKSIPAIFNIKF